MARLWPWIQLTADPSNGSSRQPGHFVSARIGQRVPLDSFSTVSSARTLNLGWSHAPARSGHSLAGMDGGVAEPPEVREQPAVVETHRHRGLVDRATEHSGNALARLDQLPLAIDPAEAFARDDDPSRACRPSCRADLSSRRPSASRLPRRSDPTGEHEERPDEAPFEQRAQTDLEVGRVAVVKADPNVRPPRDGVQDPVERVDRDPVAVLARVEPTLGIADPVEADATDTESFDLPLHRPGCSRGRRAVAERAHL